MLCCWRLVDIHRHMQFLKRLIEMLDRFGAMAAKITFGVSHQIVPSVLNLFDRFADDRMRSLR